MQIQKTSNVLYIVATLKFKLANLLRERKMAEKLILYRAYIKRPVARNGLQKPELLHPFVTRNNTIHINTKILLQLTIYLTFQELK